MLKGKCTTSELCSATGGAPKPVFHLYLLWLQHAQLPRNRDLAILVADSDCFTSCLLPLASCLLRMRRNSRLTGKGSPMKKFTIWLVWRNSTNKELTTRMNTGTVSLKHWLASLPTVWLMYNLEFKCMTLYSLLAWQQNTQVVRLEMHSRRQADVGPAAT